MGLCSKISGTIQEVSGQDTTTVEPLSPGVSCYACGLEDVDPELDVPGSYGNYQRNSTPAGKKMYNFTCDIADKMGLDDKWIRSCPHGTKSCFWSQGTYGKQGKLKIMSELRGWHSGLFYLNVYINGVPAIVKVVVCVTKN